MARHRQPYSLMSLLIAYIKTGLSMKKQHITGIATKATVSTSCPGSDASLAKRTLLHSWFPCFVLSRVDYCNSLLTGLPRTSDEPLQDVHNAAARMDCMVLNLGCRNHMW